MYRNDGTTQKGNCIELTGTEGVSFLNGTEVVVQNNFCASRLFYIKLTRESPINSFFNFKTHTLGTVNSVTLSSTRSRSQLQSNRIVLFSARLTCQVFPIFTVFYVHNVLYIFNSFYLISLRTLHVCYFSSYSSSVYLPLLILHNLLLIINFNSML